MAMAANIEISIDGFTGPLDLLCHLVESRQMQASKIKVTQLVRIYGAYLSKTRNASAEVISEFFFMAANLLLQKVLSLLPSDNDDGLADMDDPDESYDDVISPEELLARLSRFSPYRTATAHLLERKEKQARRFRRIQPEQSEQLKTPDRAPIFELGDLYSLSKLWWDLLNAAKEKNERNDEYTDEDSPWDGVPESLPDEARIQTRIDEISERLRSSPSMLFSSLIKEQRMASARSAVVVTLLALLEMCRMKKISVFQEVLFGEVRIDIALGDGVAY